MNFQADIEGPDQTAQLRSLIRAIAVRICHSGTFSDGIEIIFFECCLTTNNKRPTGHDSLTWYKQLLHGC